MPFRSILPLALMSAVALLPHSDFSTTLTFYTNEPRCCHAATSERRRIRLKADYYYIALRGASFRRSRCGNSEAVFFRGTLPRRTASGARGVVMTKRDRHLASVTMQRIVCPLYFSYIFDRLFHFPYFRFAYVANLTYTLIP